MRKRDTKGDHNWDTIMKADVEALASELMLKKKKKKKKKVTSRVLICKLKRKVANRDFTQI